MALLNIINIGFVMVLINIKAEKFSIGGLPIFDGEYADATPMFFGKIGTKIVITMILMLFTIHGANLAFAGCCALKRKHDRGFTSDEHRTKTLTQFDYEDMNTGIEFSIDYRYANLLTWLFVVMIYGTGMPILYPIGALNFFIGYWVDKYLLLNHYRKPPMYTSFIILSVITWFRWALLFRFAISIWTFSNEKALPSTGKSLLNNSRYDYIAMVVVIGVTWLVFKLIYVPCKNCYRRVFGKNNTVHLAAAEEAVRDFYDVCSYACLKENYQSTIEESKIYEHMKSSYEEM